MICERGEGVVFLRRASLCASMVMLLVLVVTLQPSAQQGDKKPDPQTTAKSPQSDSKPAPVVPSPDPSPYAGQETRQFNKEYIQTQRDIAVASKETADYTFVLIWVGVGVGVLQIIILVGHARIYWSQLKTTKATERAYLDMSHTPPGMRQHPNGGFVVSLGIKNNGNTPGDIFGGRVWVATTDKPGYQWVKLVEISKIPPAYINPSDTISISNIAAPITPAILKTAVTIWIVAEIDYLDRFGDAHHSGYGRRYVAQLTENNLVFDESTTGMNYDRPLSNAKRREYDR